MLCWWMAGFAAPSFAQSEPSQSADARRAQAKELYKLGSGLYKAGRYREAIVSFQEAYELSDNKKILYNIAAAQERLGDLEGAIESLTAYRPVAPPGDVVSLDLRIAALRDRLAELPEPAPEPVPPPLPAATVRDAPAPTPLPGADVGPQRQPRWALVGTGAAIGVLAGAAGTYTYLEGLDARDADDEDRYQVNRTINNIALPVAGVGAGLAILGLALQKETVSVSANPTGATLRLTF